MPRYKVSGANKDTGKEITVSVEADTPAEALDLVSKRRGLLVSNVELESTLPPTLPEAATKSDDGPQLDWRRLETTIARGVFRGILWIWLLSIVLWIIVAYLFSII